MLSRILMRRKDDTILDVTDLITETNLHEDLFTTFVTGTCMFIDSVDLWSTFGVHSGSVLIFDFEVTTIEFVIVKVTNKTAVNDTTSSYLVHFISEEGLLDHVHILERKYTGTVSEIVSTIFEDEIFTDKPLNIEPTEETIDFVMPCCAPSTGISFIGRLAANKSKQAVYAFWENIFSGFHFESLQRKFEATDTDYEEPFVYESTTGAQRNPHNMINFEVDVFDNMEQTICIENPKFTLLSFIDKTVSVKTTETEPRANIMWNQVRTKSDIGFNRTMNSGIGLDLKTNQNKSFIEKIGLERSVVTFMIPGNFKIQAGITIPIVMKKFKNTITKDSIDEELSGRYLVTATKHSISQTEHWTVVEARKVLE